MNNFFKYLKYVYIFVDILNEQPSPEIYYGELYEL